MKDTIEQELIRLMNSDHWKRASEGQRANMIHGISVKHAHKASYEAGYNPQTNNSKNNK